MQKTKIKVHFSEEMRDNTKLIGKIFTNELEPPDLRISEPLNLINISSPSEYTTNSLVRLESSNLLKVTSYGEVFKELNDEVTARYNQKVREDLQKGRTDLENKIAEEKDPSVIKILTNALENLAEYDNSISNNGEVSYTDALSAVSFEVEGEFNDRVAGLILEGLNVLVNYLVGLEVLKVEYETTVVTVGELHILQGVH